MLTSQEFSQLKIRELMNRMGQELQGVGIEDALREAQLLLTHCLELDPLQLMRIESKMLESEQAIRLESLFIRRKNREPMAYLFEERDFFGRAFSVGPGALIPRPETEHLIEWVSEVHQKQAYKKGVDLCAGPGTIGITLALELNLPMTLVELSEEAMDWAKLNLQKFKLENKLELIKADVTRAVEHEKVDLLVSNPPYIPSSDLLNLQREVRDFEPKLALDGGDDGLDFMKRMMAQASSLALPGCHFYLELGIGQQELLGSCDFEFWECDGWRLDLARIPRIVRYTFKP